ncbi:MAG: hypothetical protein WKF78_05655 [Candidatus Limnocylindrales bacterium]
MIETGTEGGRPCAGLHIHHNIMYKADIRSDREERGMYARCLSDSVVERNTFDGLDRFAIGLYAGSGGFNGPVEALVIQDNVIAYGRAFSIDSRLPTSVSIDRDVIFPCRTGVCPILGRDVGFVQGRGGTDHIRTFREWTGFEANGAVSDPLFVDRAARDYRLRPDSAAAGRAGALDPAPGG